MSRINVIPIALGAILVSSANAACPASECNYLDPQYAADFKKWGDCTSANTNRVSREMETLAALYPKFGIAYRAFLDDVKSAVHTDGTSDDLALRAAKERFDDRILNTAEPEALQYYNMFQLALRQHPSDCGPVPTPPRKQQ